VNKIRDTDDFFLSIAATDPSGEAGVTKDCKVADHFGYNSLSAITAITIQNDLSVRDIYPVADHILEEQLEICSEYSIRSIKIGALSNSHQARLIADALSHFPEAVIVWDPVFAPTQGKEFIAADQFGELCNALLPRADIITPNYDELLMILASIRNEFSNKIFVPGEKPISADLFDIRAGNSKKWDINKHILAAIQNICTTHFCSFYITGGHDSNEGETLREYLIDESCIRSFEYQRKNFRYTHGTGCTFSSALACLIKKTSDIVKACKMSSEFVAAIYDYD